jgi:release factor glutamine methyltransferase
MIDLCRERPDRRWHILDVGTGSGCIAITIAAYSKNAAVLGTDISAAALEVAARNVDRHGLTDRVRLIEADGVDLPAELIPEGGFDAIVSNPPYISEDQWPELPPNVRDHEPKLALALDGSDGLVMYRRLAAEAPAVLQPGGRLLVEIGQNQHEAVREIFASPGRWTYIGSHRDPTDPHERVVEFALG